MFLPRLRSPPNNKDSNLEVCVLETGRSIPLKSVLFFFFPLKLSFQNSSSYQAVAKSRPSSGEDSATLSLDTIDNDGVAEMLLTWGSVKPASTELSSGVNADISKSSNSESGADQSSNRGRRGLSTGKIRDTTKRIGGSCNKCDLSPLSHASQISGGDSFARVEAWSTSRTTSRTTSSSSNNFPKKAYSSGARRSWSDSSSTVSTTISMGMKRERAAKRIRVREREKLAARAIFRRDMLLWESGWNPSPALQEILVTRIQVLKGM